jgi:hypothetical protein
LIFSNTFNAAPAERVELVGKGMALIMVKKFVLPVLLAGALLTVSIPASALAGESGGGGRSYSGGRGNSGGRSYSGGHGNSGRGYSDGRSYSGQRGYSGGQAHSGGRGYYSGRDYDRGRGWSHGDRNRYYGGRGFSFGYYSAPYAYGPGYYYAPPPCNPPGYYDQWGNWNYYPGCYAGPSGY